MNKTLLRFLSIVLCLISCKPTVNYLGRSYAPSTQVEIFFDEQDIEKDYVVMGRMENNGHPGEIDNAEDVQAAMLAKAKSVGADAILFGGMPQEKWISDEAKTSVEEDEDSKTVRTTNSVNTVRIYNAILPKYRD